MATPKNSILNLGPDQFVAALDELGLMGEERARLEQQYFAQNRTLPMTERPEGRRIGTFAPMSFPEGMTGSEALMSGDWEFAVPEFIRGMYEAPAEAANVAGAAAKGVPVTEQQLQEAAINAAGSTVGLGSVARPLDLAVDAAQRRAAAEYFNVPRPEYDPSAASGSRFYYPSRDEAHMMLQNPTPMEQVYMTAADEAENMLRKGVSPETVHSATGILPVPLRDTVGGDAGYRLVAGMDDLEFDAIRPVSAYKTEVFMDPELKGYSMGYFEANPEGGGPEDIRIGINPKISGEEKARTLTHEMTHADLFEADIGHNELGMNEQAARSYKMEALQNIDDLLAKSTDDAEKAELKKMRDDLVNTTAFELYSRNPGEMLARLSEGDPSMARRMTAAELANPYINEAGFLSRYASALDTAVLSETNPYMLRLMKKFPNLVGSYIPTSDVHRRVPMDMSKAIIADPGYYPQNPVRVVDPNDYSQANMTGAGPDPWANVGFANGGVVEGSYLDVDPLDPNIR